MRSPRRSYGWSKPCIGTHNNEEGELPFVHPENAVRLPATILVILAAIFPNEKFHATFTLLSVAMFIGFVSVSYHA